MNSLRREIVFTGLVLVLTLVHPSLIILGQKMKGIKLAGKNVLHGGNTYGRSTTPDKIHIWAHLSFRLGTIS